MIISIKDNWKNAEKEHALFLKKIISSYLEKDRSRSDGKVRAREFIEDTYHLLILCGEKDIEESISRFEYYKGLLSYDIVQQKAYIKKIKELFKYDDFVKKKGEWNAYKLCKMSLARTCPYCNQSYAFTIQVDKRGFRPTLDHFYCKNKYPHLALVLNNLIPCCSTCNSSLKGQVDFYTKHHLNPLWDDENISFSISHIEGPAGLAVKLKEKSEGAVLSLTASTLCEKTKRSMKTFMLQDRYELMAFEAVDFTLSKENFKEARSTGIRHFADEDEALIIRFDKTKYRQYLLGRMFHDISEQIDKG
ncbi:hypothetical protein ACIP6T_24665 [Pantoea sp. NPDC088449]|uniref:hypothetical protein n=1 Tax=Pantoea sp. NPDC088449 TaxID=3364392 RepID=UPI0037F26EF0